MAYRRRNSSTGSTTVIRLALITAITLAGCGSANIKAKNIDEQPAEMSKTKSSSSEPPQITEIHKDALEKLLADGPASILAMVQTDSYMQNGKFAGFAIVAFRTTPPAFLDLREGDVVTSINNLPIERPEQYFKIFEALKTATELKFDILREGEAQTLIYPILP